MQHVIEVDGNKIILHHRPPFDEEFQEHIRFKKLNKAAKLEAEQLKNDLEKEIAVAAVDLEHSNFMFDLVKNKMVYKVEGDLPEVEWIESLTSKIDLSREEKIWLVLKKAYKWDVLDIALKYFGPRKIAIDPQNKDQFEKHLPMFIDAFIKSGMVEKLAEKN